MSKPLENWEGLVGVQTRPMKHEESELFIKLHFMPRPALVGCLGELRQRDPITIILTERLELTGWLDAIDPDVVIFCSHLCEGRPGTAVLWAFTLAKMAKRRSPVTMEIDSWSGAFAHGVPTIEAVRQAWQTQKGPDRENLLDLTDTWPAREKATHE